MPADEIFDVECDVFAPCALGRGAQRRLDPASCAASIVAGAANNQLDERPARRRSCTTAASSTPRTTSINAGGLINVYNELVGYNRERAMRMTRGIFANMARLFEISRATVDPHLSWRPTAWPRSASPG